MFMINLDAESHYSVLGISPTASREEIRQARDGLIRKVEEQKRREPARREELEAKAKKINAVGDTLARPKERAEYDKANTHLRLFTVRTGAAPMFTDAADRVDALYRAVQAHLRRAGVVLAPCSDIDRWDFTADETPSPLLDELLR